MKTIYQKPEIFFIKSNEIVRRLDPYFYFLQNDELLKKIKNSKFKKKELSEVAELGRGAFSFRPRNDPRFYGGKYPFIQTGNIVEASVGNYKIKFNKTLNEEGLKVSKLFDDKLILINIAANIGETAILDYPACFPDSVVAIKPKQENLNLEYLNYYLKLLKEYLNNLAPQSAQRNLNLEQLAPTPIIIPPKEIQEQIVGLMDKAYNLKKQNEQKAKELTESVDDYVFDELGIKIPKIKDKMAFVIKSNELENDRIDVEYHQEKYQKIKKALSVGEYKLSKLSDIVEYIRKGIEVGSDAYIEEGKTFLRVADFDNLGVYKNKLKYISKEIFEKNKNYQPQVNEILFSKDGTIGQSFVLDQEIDGIVSGGVVRIKTNDSLLDNYYLSYILSNKYFKLLLDNLSIGQIIKHLSISEFEKMQIPLPPLETQKEIAKEVKSRLEKAEKLKKEAEENLQKAKQEVEKILLG